MGIINKNTFSQMKAGISHGRRCLGVEERDKTECALKKWKCKQLLQNEIAAHLPASMNTAAMCSTEEHRQFGFTGTRRFFTFSSAPSTLAFTSPLQ
jgi:hypothetical protein